jgi:uncharacterized protein (TIGR03086 family)
VHIGNVAIAVGEFQRRLQFVQDSDLRLPTPCTEWNVHDLITHVIVGNLYARQLLVGQPNHEAWKGADPGGCTFADTALELMTAFAELDDPSQMCDHEAGPITAEQLLGYRAADVTVHTWDLARAIGADEALDPRAVAAAMDAYRPLLGRNLAVFGDGPSGALSRSASEQDRLFDAVGRRPFL